MTRYDIRNMSSNIVHLRAERIAEADKSAQSVVTFSRPRGYFDAQPDIRSISAEFNGERISGQTWRAAENRLVVLELTY